MPIFNTLYFTNRFRLKLSTLFFWRKKWAPKLMAENKTVLLKECQIEVVLPCNHDEIKEVWQPQQWFLKPKTNEIKLYNVKDVAITLDGIAIKGLNSCEKSYVYPVFYKKFDRSYFVETYKNKKAQKGNKEIKYLLIFDHWSKSNYFHWMIDSLLKLYVIQSYDDIRKYTVLLPKNASGFVFDSMKLFFKEVQIQTIDSNAFFKTNSITCIDYPAISGVVHPEYYNAANYFKSKLPCGKRSNQQKIFISRTKSPLRYLVNEALLTNELNLVGFDTVYTENMSVPEQAELFKFCNVLITTHGAGLTNMIFMPEDSTIIELGFKDTSRQPQCYWHLASILKQKYYFIPIDTFEKTELFEIKQSGVEQILKILTL